MGKELMAEETRDLSGISREIVLALARIQGSWDKKSKDLLKNEIFGDVMNVDTEGVSLAERALLGLVSKSVMAFVGEGSMADSFFRRKVRLSPEDQGLVTLLVLFDQEDGEDVRDWEITALLSADIAGGHSFKDTASKFKKRFENFTNTITMLVKKFAPSEENLDIDSGGEIGKMLGHLEKLYGENDETLLKNKKELEGKIFDRFGQKIGSLPQNELISFVNGFNINLGDKVLNANLEFAKGLFERILRSKQTG